MAQRDLSNFATVTEIAAKTPDMVASALADTATDYLEKSSQAKLSSDYTNMQVDLNKLSNQIKLDYQADPTMGKQKYMEGFEKLNQQYSAGVSPMLQYKWEENMSSLRGNQQMQMDNWTSKQAQTNTVYSIDQGLRNSALLAEKAGVDWAQSGGEIDAFLQADSRVNGYIKALKEAGIPLTFEKEQEVRLTDTKAFIAGSAGVSPDLAEKALSMPEISEKFTTEEKLDFISLINKTRKLQTINGIREGIQGYKDFTDTMASEDKTFIEKEIAIQEAVEAELITTEEVTSYKAGLAVANKATKNRLEKDLFPQYIQKLNDIAPIKRNPITGVVSIGGDDGAADDEEIYLRGLKDTLVDLQTDYTKNYINKDEYDAISSKIMGLADKDVGEATRQYIENVDKKVKSEFNSLPKSYQGDAARRLFYATDGKELTPEQMQVEANKINLTLTEEIRKRSKQIKEEMSKPTIEILPPSGDVDFIDAEEGGYSPEREKISFNMLEEIGQNDMTFDATIKQTGKSPQEVYDNLKEFYLMQRKDNG